MKKIYSKIEILTQDEIEQIHQVTLEVLSAVGVRFPQERILTMLEERGASIDWETSIAKLPKPLIEQALRETHPAQEEDMLPPYHGRDYNIGPGNQANIVGLSALLTTTMPSMAATIQAIEASGLRDQVKVMIGGAPVTSEYSAQIGADGYAPDASQAVTLAKSLI